MAFKVGVSLLLFCIANARGAALPGIASDEFDYHFNQLGLQFGVKVGDKAVPLKDGKVYVEFPVNTIFSLIEGEPTLFKKIFVPFKEELYMFYNPGMLERLRDVMRMKALVTYKAENWKAGIFDTQMEYTFIHPDYSEESGVVKATGKAGTSLSLEVKSNNDLVLPKFVLHPFKLEASFKPNAEFKVVYTAKDSTMDMTLSKAGQTFTLNTISKYFEHEHNYNLVVNVAEKKIVLTHSEEGTEKTKLEFVIEGSIMNLKKIQMKGKLESTLWSEAGPVESTYMVKGNDYQLNIMFNNKEIMKTKMNVQNQLLKAKINFDFLEEYKGTVYVDYDSASKKFDVKFPKEWFRDKESFGITFIGKPITANPFFGGLYTLSLLREDVPFFKVDLDYNLIIDSGKYEFVLKNAKVESLNPELVNSFFYLLPISKYEFCQGYLINGCFKKGEYVGKIFFDRVNKNIIFNKFKVEGQVKKMDAEVLNFVVDTVSTPYHINVFYPRVLQTMFNKPLDHLTLDIDQHVAGTDYSLTLTTNYEDMVMKMEKKSQHLSVKVSKHDETYVEYSQDYQLKDTASNFLFNMKPKLNFHADSFIHKELCQFSSYFCFEELVGDVHVEIADKAAKKVDTKVMFNKDAVEIYHLEANNKESPYKLVFKSPYVVPFFKYMRGYSWFSWMMPSLKTPFDVVIEFDPVTKNLKVDTNIDTYRNSVYIVPVGGDKFNVEFNHEKVAEFVAADKKVEVQRTLKDGTLLKTTVSWTSGSLLANTATVDIVYKNVPITGTFTWNLNKLAEGTIEFNVVGKKAPFFGDFTFTRKITWTSKPNTFEIVWDGKAETNMIPALATPLVTKALIEYKPNTFKVEINEELNAKKYTFFLNTTPFKIALRPFFEI